MAENPDTWNDDVKKIAQVMNDYGKDGTIGYSLMVEIEQAVVAPLRKERDEIKRAFSSFACIVMVVAIEGLADAAIIKQQPMNESHALAWVEKLAKEHRELRKQVTELTAEVKFLHEQEAGESI
jgi:pyruvate-formate lyase-activating enzyme